MVTPPFHPPPTDFCGLPLPISNLPLTIFHSLSFKLSFVPFLLFTLFTPLFYNSPLSPSLSLPLLYDFITPHLSISPSPAPSNSFTLHSLHLSFLLSSPSNAFSFFFHSLSSRLIPCSLSTWDIEAIKTGVQKKAGPAKSILYASWHHSLEYGERGKSCGL